MNYFLNCITKTGWKTHDDNHSTNKHYHHQYNKNRGGKSSVNQQYSILLPCLSIFLINQKTSFCFSLPFTVRMIQISEYLYCTGMYLLTIKSKIYEKETN